MTHVQSAIEGYLFGPEDIISGDCVSEQPVVVTRRQKQLEPGEKVYPETYEEYLERGVAHFPDLVEVESTTAVSCEDYQAFARLGAEVLACDTCPYGLTKQ
jgi:hypothetical protein